MFSLYRSVPLCCNDMGEVAHVLSMKDRLLRRSHGAFQSTRLTSLRGHTVQGSSSGGRAVRPGRSETLDNKEHSSSSRGTKEILLGGTSPA